MSHATACVRIGVREEGTGRRTAGRCAYRVSLVSIHRNSCPWITEDLSLEHGLIPAKISACRRTGAQAADFRQQWRWAVYHWTVHGTVILLAVHRAVVFGLSLRTLFSYWTILSHHVQVGASVQHEHAALTLEPATRLGTRAHLRRAILARRRSLERLELRLLRRGVCGRAGVERSSGVAEGIAEVVEREELADGLALLLLLGLGLFLVAARRRARGVEAVCAVHVMV